MLAAKGETRPMDITFSCPLCEQHMVIDEAGAGLIVPCPKCAQEVRDPLICGDCSAVICRRCGTPLESADELAMG